MAEPAARRLPWGLLLTLGLLALLVVLVYRAAPGADRPAPWRVVLAAAAVAAGAFLVLRRLQNYFWGMVAALTLALHPLHWAWSSPFDELAVRAEALELIVLAGVTAGWDLAALPYFAWRAWLVTALAVTVGGGLAWTAAPQAGLVAGLLTAVGLPLGALWTALRHRERPSRWNLTAAVLLGVAGPPVALLLACGSVRALDWPVSPGLGPDSGVSDFLAAALSPEAAGLQALGYAGEQLRHWAWPAAWAVLPLLALGLWGAVRRGLKQFNARRPPLPWVLVLYTFAELAGLMLYPRGRLEAALLSLAALALLLAFFAAAELARALIRPLILPPPGERTAEAQ
jgi:hypothetical protein